MKKHYYYLLLLILNVSFLPAQDDSTETISKDQTTQEIAAITESSSANPSISSADSKLTSIKSPTEEVAIIEPTSFTQSSISPNELTPLDVKKIEAPKVVAPHKNSFLAVSLSIIPGLGHVYLGDYKTAGTLFGSSAISIGAMFNDRSRLIGGTSFDTALFYGIFAAYRDVRKYNNNLGYSYKMPTDSFKELSLAPFSLKVLKKPEVWGGFLGAYALATGVGYLQHKIAPYTSCKIVSADATPLQAFAVGLREEVLFRGYLQPMLSETFTPVGGIIITSILFGAAHIPNARYLNPEDRITYYTFSLPFITSFGAYCGWLTYKNKSLQESIAIHSWYDFTIFALRRSFTRSAMIGKPSFAFSISF